MQTLHVGSQTIVRTGSGIRLASPSLGAVGALAASAALAAAAATTP
jgi:hypothetical protein